MRLEYWQLGLGAFAVAAVFVAATAYVIAKPTYSNGYKQAVEDITQAYMTVSVVANRMRGEGNIIDWRELCKEMQTIPLAVLHQHRQDHFQFVDTAQEIVKAAIRNEVDDVS